MSETESVDLVNVIKKRLDSGDEDRKKLGQRLEKIYINSQELGKNVNCSYRGEIDGVPYEFKNPTAFLQSIDNTKESVGNTIRLLGVFKSQNPPPPEKTNKNSQSPVIIMNKDKEKSPPTRLPVKGWLSGFHDVSIARMELASKIRRDEKPTIISQKVTYNLEDAIHQILPTLNELKDTYFTFQDRHETYPKGAPSYDLLIHGHKEIRGRVNKLLLIVDAFCYASIAYQEEKILEIQLHQLDRLGRIEEARAQALALTSMHPRAPQWVDPMAEEMRKRIPRK